MISGIESLIKEKPFVLLDGCAIDRVCWFWEQGYEARRYSDLEVEPIYKNLQNIQEIKRLFQYESLHTVSGIVEELSKFQKILRDKIKWLNEKEEYFKPNEGREYIHPQELKETISSLNLNYIHILNKLSRRICDNSSSEFQELFGQVKSIAIKSNLKRYQGEKYGRLPKSKEELNNNTADEELVAHAFYSSLRNIPSTIITADGDIPRIVKAVQLSLDDGYLLEKIHNSAPIEVYHVRNTTLEQRFVSAEFV